MHADTPASTGRAASEDAIFSRVVVGIDDTPESLVAAAQAGVLREPSGHLVLLAVTEGYLAAHAGLSAVHAASDLEAATSADLARAQELVDADDVAVASGRLVDVLNVECRRRDSTLIAVGVRPHRRVSALTFGGHDIEALHAVRCSLLIARPGWGPHKPDRVVLAVDGSPESHRAEVAGRRLADRLAVEVLPVVGLGDRVDLEVLREERADALLDPRRLVKAVVAASTSASLVVVGGAQPRRRWGASMVERVVYSVRCSVLVVR
jgi:nucleotide-binding universal stress UspA family protein